MKSRKFYAVLFGSVLTLLVVGGLVLAGSGDFLSSVRMLDQVAAKVTENYVEDVNIDTLVSAGIYGMLGQLDPYSEYLEPKPLDQLMEDTRGRFEGIGIEIAIQADSLTVVTPLEGSPASRAGLVAGDRIVTIEGKPTAGMSTEDAARLLRGPKGTEVSVGIMRGGAAEPIPFTITRGVIEIKAVPYYGMVGDGIGYIRLSRFSNQSAEELAQAVSELKKENPKGLILDVRSNPGGLLEEAVGISELFLQPNQLVVETRGRRTDQNQRFFASRPPILPDVPLVVAVDEGSASAAEIVAGAIQDWDRGVVVGNQTFGKGLVQSLLGLPEGRALKLTTARYYTPSGRSIQKQERAGGLKNDSAATAEKFKTKKSGRMVAGGGGITPDVETEKPKYSPLEIELGRRALIWEFGVHYADGHPEIKEGFEVTEPVLAEFRRFLKEKKFAFRSAAEEELKKLDSLAKESDFSAGTKTKLQELKASLEAEKEKEFTASLDFIRRQLKESILTKVFGDRAKYPLVWMKTHPELVKAKEILISKEQYKKLLASAR
ncbi:MAG: S41 family peptidase [candidate division Zixibacteria bacterium]|nr:S41 family peptidase [candidate division Zixibacteria bacterium]MCI0596347.1 S41 family peptidase [candidate division Zixibacteria bacterium]